MRFTATVANTLPATRTNPTGADADAQAAFSPGDCMGISALGQQEVTYTLQQGGTWQPQAEKFLTWETNTMTFSAYYPVGANADLSQDTNGSISLTTDARNFALPNNQSNKERIAQADYMTLENERIARPQNSDAVSLQLKRKMARVIVQIEKFNDEYATGQQQLQSLTLHSRAAAYKQGNVVTIANSDIEITPYAVNTSSTGTGYAVGSTFTALLLPDAERADDTFIKLTDAKGNTLSVKGKPLHEAGMSYTYTLTVGKNLIAITDNIVENWTDGEVITGGETEPIFDDPAFVTELHETYNVPLTNGIIDPNQPETKAALEKITRLTLKNKGIRSLRGIEYLTKLTTLDCSSNNLAALDVSKNTELTTLDCSSNRFTTLDVSQHTKLTLLTCANTPLNTLTLPTSTGLKILNCSNTKLAALDVSMYTGLTHLYCSLNKALTTLDVSKNTQLTTLDCSESSIATLKLPTSTVLKELRCNNNKLTTLDVRQYTGLTTLFCYSNQLDALDISSITGKLDYFICGDQTDASGAAKPITLTLTQVQKDQFGEDWYYGLNIDFNIIPTP